MEWLKKLSAAIDYIENNLDGDISYDEAAEIACCPTFYFQQIFSYVAGVSLSEYIQQFAFPFKLQEETLCRIILLKNYPFRSVDCHKKRTGRTEYVSFKVERWPLSNGCQEGGNFSKKQYHIPTAP